jgi:uncharacterized protein YjbJ (UPF0337 family)
MAGEHDILTGKWNEVKGDMRKWWGKLTDDDWQAINGQRDVLLGRLQQRYGWSRMQAEEEYNRRMSEYNRVHTM